MFLPRALSRLSSGRLDDLVGITVGIVHRRPVFRARRIVMAALLVLNTLSFGFVELILALHRTLRHW